MERNRIDPFLIHIDLKFGQVHLSLSFRLVAHGPCSYTTKKWLRNSTKSYYSLGNSCFCVETCEPVVLVYPIHILSYPIFYPQYFTTLLFGTLYCTVPFIMPNLEIIDFLENSLVLLFLLRWILLVCLTLILSWKVAHFYL